MTQAKAHAVRAFKKGVNPALLGLMLTTLFLFLPSTSGAFDNSRLFQDAKSGDPEAQYTLAHQYLKGRGGLAKDVAKGVYWLGHAADNGHRDGAFDLGILYLSGEAIDGNRAKALYRIEQAAKNGHQEAQYMLGMAHWQSDPEAAAEWA